MILTALILIMWGVYAFLAGHGQGRYKDLTHHYLSMMLALGSVFSLSVVSLVNQGMQGHFSVFMEVPVLEIIGVLIVTTALYLVYGGLWFIVGYKIGIHQRREAIIKEALRKIKEWSLHRLHQIDLFECQSCDYVYVYPGYPVASACPKCGKTDCRQVGNGVIMK